VLLTNGRAVRAGIIAAVPLACLIAVHAQAQTTLRWNLKPGERFGYTIRQNAVTTMNLNKMTITTKLNQTTDMTWHVKAVDNTGKAEIAQTIDRIRLKAEGGPVGVIEYDSKEAKKPKGPAEQALGTMLGAMVGAEFTMKIDPHGDVSDVKIPEKMTTMLKNMPGAARLGDLFSEEGIKRLTGASGFVLPKTAVSKGQTWTNEAQMKMPFGLVRANNEFTYQGPAQHDGRDTEKIGIKTALSLEPAPGGKIQFKVTSTDAQGATYFDNVAGRVLESDMTQNLAMQFNVVGSSTEQEVHTSVSVNMKLADRADADKTNQGSP